MIGTHFIEVVAFEDVSVRLAEMALVVGYARLKAREVAMLAQGGAAGKISETRKLAAILGRKSWA